MGKHTDLFFFVVIPSLLVTGSFSLGKPGFGKNEPKACTFCHACGKFKELTGAAKCYKEHDASLERRKAGVETGKD